ncbi:MAG TPA: acyltransferase [Sphingomicrobium sp.]|nr:acyltransferase [Sphingomicrobium sp.]
MFGQPVKLAAGWMLSHLSFSANVLTAIEGFSPVPFTSHLWTMSLEEQAYFVIPMLLLAVSRAKPSRRMVAMGAGAVLLALTLGRCGLWLAGVSTDAIFVLPFRADGIVLGVAAALIFEDRALPDKRLCWAIAAVILSVVALSSIDQGMLGDAMLVGYSVAIGGCLAALLATVQSNFTFRPIVYLGKISYGIYVYHLLMIRVAERGPEAAGVTSPVAVLALSVALTIAASAASYHLYEARFLRLKDRFAVVLSRPV